MTQIQAIKAEIEQRLHCNGAFDEVGDSAWEYDQGMVDAYKHIISFIESLEQEPKGKTNPLFEECVAKADPATMKEVSENVDKLQR